MTFVPMQNPGTWHWLFTTAQAFRTSIRYTLPMPEPHPPSSEQTPAAASTQARPRILLLSGYDAGSHRRWREQLVATQPAFDWTALTLPPRYFRWRIRGNALSWLDEPAMQERWDLVVATSMVDVAGIRALHPALRDVPVLLYMHENQFAYPDSGDQHSSVDPLMVNLYSALSAERVAFNSDWNRRSFLDGINRLLGKLPDAVPHGVADRIDAKSTVLPVPIDDALFGAPRRINSACPHLLWNHRREYDKGPDRLLALLAELEAMGQPFTLSVVGEQFRREPAEFNDIQQRFAERITHWGFLPDRASYDRLLTTADIVISTATHDFQGLSMLEAMAAGCLPLAPDRLSYPEYIPDACRYPAISTDPLAEGQGAARHLVALLKNLPDQRSPEEWRLSRLQPAYYALIAGLMV
ncbi:tRNA-queuosine alpha-mannosyltransferase domain-containing protein [Marinobacter sp. V034]|uniref:tRNA-queuosine alpha-mannosyltransferase domain-containing protein n=1 Tax=Marinobacter sp. V034 TaxID=3459610 RepID=UPI004044C4D5